MARTIHHLRGRAAAALIRRPAALLFLGILAAAVTGCSKPAPPSPAPRPVRTLVLGAVAAGHEKTFSGTARPSVGSMLSFRVAGEVKEVAVRLGMKVSTGDVIARLDATDYELQLKQLEAQFAQADAQLKQLRSQYERTRQLYEANSASRSDLDRDRAGFESGQAQRDAVQQSLDLARQQVEYCTLRAPMEGTISTSPVDPHTTVQAGQSIVGLNAGGTLEIEVGVPEKLVGRLRGGARAAAEFDAIPGARFEAEVLDVGIEASNASTYPVKLRLLGEDARILAGMVCEVSFDLPPDAGMEPLAVPAVAVDTTPEGERYAWVVEGGVVHRRVVQVGALVSDGLEIRAGLAPGDTVVIRGVHQLTEGQAVRLLQE